MSKEAIYNVDLGPIQCNSRKEATRIGNRITTHITRLVGRTAMCLIVLSNIDEKTEHVIVTENNHKWIELIKGSAPSNTNWHLHITVLACPGYTVAKEIGDYLLQIFPNKKGAWIQHDKDAIGKYTQNRVNYLINQSVIIRTVQIGNTSTLNMKNDFLRLVDSASKKRGYRWLGITK